jgi:CRISPR/Cas system CSM-associated protein Csm3 (group 7 of RAMP superfamily)
VITLLLMEIAIQPGWAVGAVPIDDPTLDRDLLLDTHGHPWVPGSSLAGSLRAHLRAHDAAADGSMETQLMGSPPPAHRDDPATASPLWLLGTRFTPAPETGQDTAAATPVNPQPSPPTSVETVGQTAIDRHRGAAAVTSLRYSRTVASGGILTAFLRYDGQLTADQLAALARWQPAIGRDRTTGGGTARLQSLRYGTVDPAQPAGRRTWLTHTGEALVRAVATTDMPIADPDDEPWLTAELAIDDALLIGDPRPTGPALSRIRNGRAVVPGSAWKGLFRSRIEYILRSLYGEGAVCHSPGGCGHCRTCEVFGHHQHRGLLAFADSTIDTDQVTQQPPTHPPVRTQVGIDRVTGGAADGLLFQSAPVTVGRLRLRIDALAPVEDWVHTAAWHVLHDLHDGLIGIGSRVTRGMGTLRLIQPPPHPGPVIVPALHHQTETIDQ